MSELGQKLIAEVRKVAAERPDYIYQSSGPADACWYMHNGEPSCIMGQAMYRLGAIGPSNPQSGRIENKNVSDALHILNINVDHPEADWLDEVQAAQDGRHLKPFGSELGKPLPPKLSWSAAVAQADERVKLT